MNVTFSGNGQCGTLFKTFVIQDVCELQKELPEECTLKLNIEIEDGYKSITTIEITRYGQTWYFTEASRNVFSSYFQAKSKAADAAKNVILSSALAS